MFQRDAESGAFAHNRIFRNTGIREYERSRSGKDSLNGFVFTVVKDFRRRPALPRIASAVPSALEGLTAGFGMEPGMTPPPLPPKIQCIYPTDPVRIIKKETPKKRGKGLGVLVPVSSTPRRAYTSGLSIP